jgi:predicted deacylase
MVITKKVESFDPQEVGRGSKQAFYLELSALVSGDATGIPVFVANGSQKGKTLVAVSGVHGDEYEGVQAIHELFRDLNPEAMCGNVIAVPIANLAAHRALNRLNPIDNLNLARVFPGRIDGTISERIAYYLTEKIIGHADFLIDLHSGGIKYMFPPLVGYPLQNSQMGKVSREAALTLGTPVMWGHAGTIPTGRTVSVANERGVPWLYLEAAGGGRIRPHELLTYIKGLSNLLKYLKIVKGPTEDPGSKFDLEGDGDVDSAISTETSGFFAPVVRLLEQVAERQIIGTVRDVFGHTLEEIRSPRRGYVLMLRALPVVYAGETVCMLANDKSGDTASTVNVHI